MAYLYRAVLTGYRSYVPGSIQGWSRSHFTYTKLIGWVKDITSIAGSLGFDSRVSRVVRQRPATVATFRSYVTQVLSRADGSRHSSQASG